MIITIDGPAASGKSTVARTLAHDIGFVYLNTGLLYRAVAYVLVHEHGYVPEKLDQVKDQDCEMCQFGDDSCFAYVYDDDGVHILYKKHELTHELNNMLVGEWASKLSTNPTVRKYLLATQRLLANSKNTVADGRDCGSVVFPNADYKFFITARDDVRAQRFQSDQIKHGCEITLAQALELIVKRDTRDTQRAIAPLLIPSGADVIDTTHRDVQQVVDLIRVLLGR